MTKEDSIDQKIILKLQTYLSKRPHSEYELTCKLRKHFPVQYIEKALKSARSHNWLSSPQELSQQLTEELNRKKKGWLLIQKALKQKKLPLVSKNESVEEQKARWWVLKKLNASNTISYEMTQKIYRFLTNRGFEEDIIKKVMYEYQNKQEENL